MTYECVSKQYVNKYSQLQKIKNILFNDLSLTKKT